MLKPDPTESVWKRRGNSRVRKSRRSGEARVGRGNEYLGSTERISTISFIIT